VVGWPDARCGRVGELSERPIGGDGGFVALLTEGRRSLGDTGDDCSKEKRFGLAAELAVACVASGSKVDGLDGVGAPDDSDPGPAIECSVFVAGGLGRDDKRLGIIGCSAAGAAETLTRIGIGR
jgi:hypothetical protein